MRVAEHGTRSRKARSVAALAVAIVAGAFTLALSRHTPTLPPDFGVTWRGAQALLAGADPYASVGPGRRFAFDFPLLYPMPAVLLDLPLAALPADVARAIFAAATFGLAAFGLTRRAWYPLAALTSSAALGTLVVTQWSAAMLAAATLPAMAWLAAAKPNVGLAIAAAWTTRRQWAWGVGGALLLCVVGLALVPGWPIEWLHALPLAPHIRSPLSIPGGVLVLLALLRWRRAEARLLVMLACVPHTPAYYDALPLFLVPSSLREALLLSALTWAAVSVEAFVGPAGAGYGGMMDKRGLVILLLLYLPCLAMVLRRPNEGDVPARLDRVVRSVYARVTAWRHHTRGATS